MSVESRSEMTESEMTVRKFLKQLGVTGHQKLSEVLEEAVRSGKLITGGDVVVNAKIEIIELEFSHDVTATLRTP